jgi:hypothetical protein
MAAKRKYRRRRVGDVSTDINIGIIAAIGVGIYVLYQYLSPSSNQNAGSAGTSNTAGAAAAAADLQAQTAAGDGPNYDTTQYNSWADTIYSSASHFGSWFSDNGTVLNIMDQMDNLADVYSLIEAFGTRSFSFWAGPQNYSLPGFINAAFSSNAIASFNQQLAYNNVAYTF